MNRYAITYDTKRNGNTHHHRTYAWANSAEEVRNSFRAQNATRRATGAPHLFHVEVRRAPEPSSTERLGLILGKALLPRA